MRQRFEPGGGRETLCRWVECKMIFISQNKGNYDASPFAPNKNILYHKLVTPHENAMYGKFNIIS